MTDKTEAQPEALRLAERLDLYATGDEHQRDVEDSADELRRQHAEIQQLKAQLSARQAAPDGWRLVPELATLNMLNTAFGICTQNGRPVQQMIDAAAAKYAAMLSAAPPPPERGPLTDELIWAMEQLMNWQVKNVQKWHNHAYDNAQHVLEKFKAAHGIGATNDNP